MSLTSDDITRVFTLLFGCPPREADLEIVTKVMDVSVDALSDYLWDHHLGEPLDPSWHQVRVLVQTILEHPDLPDEEVLDRAARAMADEVENVEESRRR